MAGNEARRTPGLVSRERAALLALVVLAALRVGVFAGAFPFFTNVDEHRHVDMVLKYARGYVPQPGDDAYEPQTPALIAFHGSPEYAAARDRTLPPPVWDPASRGYTARLQRNEELFRRGPNLEANAPPVFYATAGVWLAGVRLLGLSSAAELYAVRALNALAFALLVAFAWHGLRAAVPDEPFLAWGVASLLAVFPMDALFYVTPDAFSPLVVGVAFLGILQAGGPGGSRKAWVWAGLAAALAFLTKYTNAMIAAALVVASVERWRRDGTAAFARGPLVAWVAFAVPAVAYLARNLVVFGSLTATETKVFYLGWGRRSPLEWLDHPLFGPGAFDFVAGLVPMFWRGELVWRRDVLALPAADAVYLVTSLVLLALAGWAVVRGARVESGARRLDLASFAVLGAAVAELVVLSLGFEFHATSNPPAERPYFTQGRLISGALLPFAILYVRGIDVATRRLAPRRRFAVSASLLGVVVFVCLGSELALTGEVFDSAYNLYHLP